VRKEKEDEREGKKNQNVIDKLETRINQTSVV